MARFQGRIDRQKAVQKLRIIVEGFGLSRQGHGDRSQTAISPARMHPAQRPTISIRGIGTLKHRKHRTGAPVRPKRQKRTGRRHRITGQHRPHLERHLELRIWPRSEPLGYLRHVERIGAKHHIGTAKRGVIGPTGAGDVQLTQHGGSVSDP